MLKLWKIINYTEVFFLVQNNNINSIKIQNKELLTSKKGTQNKRLPNEG